MDSPVRRLLSLTEAAQIVGVGITTLKSLVHDGELDSVKIGRRRLVPSDAIDDLISSRRSIDLPRKSGVVE